MFSKLKYKIEIIIVAIAISALVLFLMFSPNEFPENPSEKPPFITEALLKVLKEDNADKRLEYAESQPIIKSMTKHLRQFDSLMQIDPERARAPLLIVERRLLYLKAKGLEIDNAKKILRDQVINYIAKE
ncbi:hypothetical protein [Methylomarinum vadi]|uniref:hypothetical protein n=1 Tax=Methylomarinum vadi TaxID=438855 RepID=UPI0004DF7AD6|nr:hypothetical protein [Methylomarinum vadi]